MQLVHELRRRNVLRMAGVYLVAAWLVVQVGATLLPVFDAPPWAMRALVATLAIGFVVALVFSWVFELTPEGLRRDADVPPEQSIAPRTARHLDRILLAVSTLALGYFAFDKFVLSPRREEAIARTATEAAESKAQSRDAATLVSHTQPAPAKSIAVLPFENLSTEKANGYFADGIQDQILTSLAKIGDLKVISRTSTQRYASRPASLTDIAHELGVAHVLEGSVQRAGEHVRVIVQLIDATSDSHLWAETYDRTLDDLFAVQSEIAQKVAESLAARLTRVELAALEQKPTGNPRAYEAYLKARALDADSKATRADTDLLLDAYREATRLDPDFALAWAGFAKVAVRTWWTGLDTSGELRDEGRAALDRATKLAAGTPHVEMARGVYQYYVERDYRAAYATMTSLQSRLPGDTDVWMYSALLARRLGEWDDSVDAFMRARALAPNDAQIAYHLGTTLMSMRRYADAPPQFDASLAAAPGNSQALASKMVCLWLLGDLAGASKTLSDNEARTPLWHALKGEQALLERDYAAASRWLREAIDTDDGTQVDASFDGYIPSRIDWQLMLALSTGRSGSSAEARSLYERVETEARSALAAPSINANAKGGWLSALALALAGRGDATGSAHASEMAISLTEDPIDQPTWMYYQAEASALAGDAKRAVPLATRLLQTNGSWFTVEWIELDPDWDPIRNDPAIQALVRTARAK
ncbi:MAG TPA: hypothetical protein VHC92_10220 [Rhodanobacteraceae bacterium]|nr:hypothetical protein [Rhodanobacteraceae bacterium]